MREILSDLEAEFLSDPDPVRRAQIQMRKPLPKRFYKGAATASVDGGFAVELDGKTARTPGGNVMLLPTEAAAALVAAEFEAQQEAIDPFAMPVMRLVNTAIDGVAADTQAVLEDILRFSASDLVCYRAEGPESLVRRQADAWDPVLDWVHATLGAFFVLGEGVMHVEQPRPAVAAVGAHLATRKDPFRLAALHVMTTLTGSALIALAVEAGALEPAAAWTAAHVDEDWQAEQWGSDAEAMARRAAREREMMAAAALLKSLGRD